jgi:hypothetical protein
MGLLACLGTLYGCLLAWLLVVILRYPAPKELDDVDVHVDRVEPSPFAALGDCGEFAALCC